MQLYRRSYWPHQGQINSYSFDNYTPLRRGSVPEFEATDDFIFEETENPPIVIETQGSNQSELNALIRGDNLKIYAIGFGALLLLVIMILLFIALK